jgi:Skp family chaperone for outer membrane proteins
LKFKKKKKMKKVLFVVLAIAGMFFANNSNAQATAKIGVFDLDIMVQAMPGYRMVDSMLQMYEQDSLRGEYEFAVKEYNRLDSTYKADSAAKKAATVLSYQKDQRSQLATTIIYWQQIAQRKTEQKRQELAAPMYEKILGAYSKVLQANNYLIVLKPEAIEFLGSSKIDNVFERVAKELKITLPEGLRSQNPQGGQAGGAAGGVAPQGPPRSGGAVRPGTRKQ